MQFTVDGKKCSRAAAKAAWCKRDGNHDAATWFELACEQSTDGYVARDAVDCAGVTIRHANEDQVVA